MILPRLLFFLFTHSRGIVWIFLTPIWQIKWGVKEGTDLPNIIQSANDIVTIGTQFFWPQGLYSFCSSLMAFLWASHGLFVSVSQPRGPRARRGESWDKELRLPPQPAPQGHGTLHSSALSCPDVTSAHNLHPERWTASHRDKAESRNLIPLLPPVEKKASLGLLLREWVHLQNINSSLFPGMFPALKADKPQVQWARHMTQASILQSDTVLIPVLCNLANVNFIG